MNFRIFFNKSIRFSPVLSEAISTFIRFVWRPFNFHLFHQMPYQLSPVVSRSTFTCYYQTKMTWYLTRNIVGEYRYLTNIIHSLISTTFTCLYNFHLLLKVWIQLSPVLMRCQSTFTRFLKMLINFHLFPNLTAEFHLFSRFGVSELDMTLSESWSMISITSSVV